MASAFSRSHPADRDILRLAVPALFTLAAEPLYVLADTAIVGHLGVAPLGGLGLASTILTTAWGLCIFLAYSTTSAVARHHGAGEPRHAVELGIQALWLALGLGVILAIAGELAARPLVGLFGGGTAVHDAAVTYLRWSLPALPFLLATLAATGYLRGVQNVRTPLIVTIAASVANLVAELVFITGLGFGIAASAITTSAVQVVAALVYIAVVVRAARGRSAQLRPDPEALRRQGRVNAAILVRTALLRGAFVGAAVVAAHLGAVALAAHEASYELWMFLALALDAVAIAAQALLGAALGAGHREQARQVGMRMMAWGAIGGTAVMIALIAARPFLPALFTADPAVRHVMLGALWIVALCQPLGGVAFVLDGLMIGVGDMAYLARCMGIAVGLFASLCALVWWSGAGINALWGAIAALLVVRVAMLGRRFVGGAWMASPASGPSELRLE